MVKLPDDAGFWPNPFPPGMNPTLRDRVAWEPGQFSFEELNPDYVTQAARGIAVQRGTLLTFCEVCGTPVRIRPTEADEDDPEYFQNNQLATVGLCPVCLGYQEPTNIAAENALKAIRGIYCETCNRMLEMTNDGGQILVSPCEMCASATEEMQRAVFAVGYAEGQKRAGKTVSEKELKELHPEDSEVYRDFISMTSPYRLHHSFSEVYHEVVEALTKRKKLAEKLRAREADDQEVTDFWHDTLDELAS